MNQHRSALWCVVLAAVASVMAATRLAAQDAQWERVGRAAVALAQEGQIDSALVLAKTHLQLVEQALGATHPAFAKGLNFMGGLLFMKGRLADAEPIFKRALAIDEAAPTPDCYGAVSVLNNLVALSLAQERRADAESYARRAVDATVNAPDDLYDETATSLGNLAGLKAQQGRYSEAEPLFKRALAVMEKGAGPDHPDVEPFLDQLARLYRRMARDKEAEPLERRAAAIRARKGG